MPRYTFNPFTSNFDRVETGGGGGGDVTITAGDGNSVTGNSFFMEGAMFKDIPVMDTFFSLGDFLIENRVWETPYVVDKSSVEGERGTFTTIQAAMDQAELDGMAFDNPRKILIRPSSTPYVEDLLIKPGSFFYADASAGALADVTPLVGIQGAHTLPAIGFYQSTGISWSCPTGNMFTGGSAFTIFMANNSKFVSSSGLILDAPTGASILNWDNCRFSASSLSFKPAIIVNNLVGCRILNCSFGNTGIQKGNGFLRMDYCQDIGSINQTVATNGIILRNCTIGGDSNPCIYGDVNGSCTVINCSFSNNSGLPAIALNGPNNMVNCYTLPNISPPSEFSAINTIAQGALQLGNILTGRESDSDVFNSSWMSYIRITDTSSPRSVIINPAFVGYRIFVYDSSGGALNNNITVASAGAKLINGDSSYIINRDFGSAEFVWNGTAWNVVSAANQPQENSLVTTFTADGFWTIDPRTKSARVIAWGGGGGGGSGRCGATTSAGGGGGGAAGGFYDTAFLASSLTASPYAVTIGQGGTGGASVNAVTTNGNPGSPGTATSLGSVALAMGGAGGSAGATGTATGGTASFFSVSGFTSSGGAGGSGSQAVGSTPSIIPNTFATGGGGGSGYTAATPRVGGAGGTIANQVTTTLNAGGLAGANTGANAGNGNSPVSQSWSIGGTGGGGGGNNGVSTAGSGGNGAVPGGGGGGGAGNLDSNPSGAGGNGGDGLMIIIEYF